MARSVTPDVLGQVAAPVQTGEGDVMGALLGGGNGTIDLALDMIRMDGGTQNRAQLDWVVIAEYSEEMKNGARFPAIDVTYDGETYWLVDGFHRVNAAKDARLETILANVKPGTRADAQWRSYGVNKSHGLRRSNEDKRRAVEAALAHPKAAALSGEQIAAHCGVSAMTVSRYRSAVLDNEKYRSELAGISNNVRDSRPSTERTVTRGDSTYTMQTGNIGKQPASNGKDTAVQVVVDEIRAPAMPHVAHNNGQSEWYTPAEYIEAARAVMGGIDLDPASTAVANEVVQAKRFHTAEEDGLARPWQGTVWMNPPYSQPLVGQFSSKLAEEYVNGFVTEAIVLVNNATETEWFATLIEVANAVCFPRGRVKFWAPDRVAAPLQGQALIYLGIQWERFMEEFSRFGWCAEVIRYAD